MMVNCWARLKGSPSGWPNGQRTATALGTRNMGRLEFFDEVAGDMPHEAPVGRGEPAEAARAGELAKSLQREDDVRVEIGVAVIVIVVSDRQILHRRGDGNPTKAGITARIGHVERTVGRQMNPTGRDQRHAAELDRTGHRRPRDVATNHDMSPTSPDASECGHAREQPTNCSGDDGMQRRPTSPASCRTGRARAHPARRVDRWARSCTALRRPFDPA